MPEAKAPRHIGCANEIELQEFVDRVHRRGLGRGRRRRCELRLERVAGDRRSFEHDACSVREQRELLGQCSGNGGRDADRRRHLRNAAPVRARALERARELLEIERVAAALLVQGLRLGSVDGSAEKVARLGAGQRAKLDARQCRGTLSALERGREALWHLPGSHGQDDEHGRSWWSAEQGAEQLGRGRVGPVEVVEHEHKRLCRRKLLEQLPDRTVAAVALVLERRRVPARERRQ